MTPEILESFSEERRNFVLAAVAGFLVASALILATGVDSGSSPGLNSSSNLTEVTFSGSSGEKSRLLVEVADTDKERRRGLMFRESLGEDRGMLFTWEEEENRSFWMKNTLIPLDIIFIDSEKNIINVEKAYPQPGAEESDLRRYMSEAPAKYVIEANLNYTDANDIHENDTVSFSLK